jgi:hypothetical protein
MICSECKIAASYNSNGKYVFAENFHKNCGGDCGCQHKTGPGWFIKAGEKAKPMQTQSP